MKHHLNFLGRATLLILLLGIAYAAPLRAADSEKILRLFAEIKVHAVLAEQDSDLLESLTRSHTSWQTHALRLAQIKEHVNDLLKDYKDAETLKSEGAKWQQEAIDRLTPLLQGLASHLTATIQHHRENPGQVRMQRYVEYVRANQEYVSRTSKLIHDIVDYGDVLAKADALEKTLELPDNSESAEK